MKQSRLKGSYFLFTLGFLLIFSSGFLAFLAWDGPGYHGSLAALEAPVSPPSLGEHPSPDSKSQPPKAKPAATLESPEPPAVAQPPVTEQAPASAKPDALDVSTGSKGDDAQTVQATEPKKSQDPDPKKEHAVQKADVKSSVSSTQKTEVKKPRKKARKSQRSAPKPIDDTVVPPEWNWFSTPMRLEIKDHKIEIVTNGSAEETIEKTDGVAMPAPLTHDSAPASVPSAAPSENVAQPPADASIKTEKSAEPSAVTPFTAPQETLGEYTERLKTILARLQVRRDKRLAEAKARSLILPSAKREASVVSGGEKSDAANTEAAEKNSQPEKPAPSPTEGLPPMPTEHPDTGN